MEKANFDIGIIDDKLTKEKLIKRAYAYPDIIKKLNDLGLNDESIKKNIVKLMDYIECEIKCAKCTGLSTCEVTNPHIYTNLEVKNGKIITSIGPCKKMSKEMIIQSRFIYKDFPENWFDSSIKNLDKTSGRLLALTKFVKNLKSDESSWLYLKGSDHSGKSFLAATFAVDFAKRKKGTIAFINCEKRLNELNSYYYIKQDDFYEILSQICASSLLIFDNFGKELKTDIIRDEVLLTILKYREEHKLLTIFTSSLSINDITDLYHKNNYSYKKAIELSKLLKKNCGKEINLGDLPIYQ